MGDNRIDYKTLARVVDVLVAANQDACTLALDIPMAYLIEWMMIGESLQEYLSPKLGKSDDHALGTSMEDRQEVVNCLVEILRNLKLCQETKEVIQMAVRRIDSGYVAYGSYFVVGEGIGYYYDCEGLDIVCDEMRKKYPRLCDEMRTGRRLRWCQERLSKSESLWRDFFADIRTWLEDHPDEDASSCSFHDLKVYSFESLCGSIEDGLSLYHYYTD